ncbi:MAG: substrate-binding domain-containing protein [Xanthomonadaceae bacterium]|nr:substrate-binding domain-containing protein [Xanthomonadaceae bacterium]
MNAQARPSCRAPVKTLVWLLLGASAVATASPAGRPATVEWLLPTAKTHAVQTPAQDEAGKQSGRPLPAPELLQPTLDAALPPFRPGAGAALQGSISIAASDTLPGLVRAWIDAFHKFYPDVRMTFGPPYEGSHGASELANDKIDIAFVSRELKPTDIAAFGARHGYPPLSVPVSGGSYRQFGFLDAVVFFVNRQNPIEHLSLAQLDSVLSRSLLSGKHAATTWGELGASGAWAARPIHVYAIKPWNGFEEFVRQRVLDKGAQRGHWRTDLHEDPTVFPIAGRVAADPDGIGYAGLAFVDAPVKMLAIGSGGHYLAPTYANVASAAYPLSRLIYANVNLKPGTAMAPPMREFLRFVLSRQGQQAVRDQAVFLPLRGFQAQRAGALLGAPAHGAQP